MHTDRRSVEHHRKGVTTGAAGVLRQRRTSWRRKDNRNFDAGAGRDRAEAAGCRMVEKRRRKEKGIPELPVRGAAGYRLGQSWQWRTRVVQILRRAFDVGNLFRSRAGSDGAA